MASSTFIIAAKRTPFGSFGGSLKHLSPTELGAIATKAALTAVSSPSFSPELISSVFFGNVLQTTPDSPYMARHAALLAGIPISAPAVTVNRLCGSGFESVIQGDLAIKAGMAECVVCGGSENMSGAPFSVDGNAVRWGVGLGNNIESVDRLWSGLTDSYAKVPMGITAENLAEKYGITREECDEYAIRSQQAWGEAKKAGRFDFEMAPIEVKTKKGMETIDTDEHPRPDTQLEKIQKLRPVFKKDGVVTAANASGICDGAGAIIIASESFVKEHNISPLARIVSYGIVGCEPEIMGIGPVKAIQQSLMKADKTLDDMKVVEINEAFAAQYLACEKELGLDREKTNMCGGAISLGHPLGASGSRILAHLVGTGCEDGGGFRVGAACIGGGQGIAVVLESA